MCSLTLQDQLRRSAELLQNHPSTQEGEDFREAP
jgi:hypothetical protein